MSSSIPKLVIEEMPNRCCMASERFLVFTDSLIKHAEMLMGEQGETAEVAINQAKVILIDRFYAERQAAPSGHRDLIQAESGALCVYGVFLHGLHRLVDLQLRESPPPLNVRPLEPVIIREQVSSPTAPPAGIWIKGNDQ